MMLTATRLALILGALTVSPLWAEDGWISLFDGKTLAGWKANESPETWSVVDGTITAKGPVSHLYYVGPDEKTQFKDFELKLEAKTAANTNSGVYIRTPWQDKGWLQGGIEAQIQNSGKSTCYTGGLWSFAPRAEPSPVKDDTWFEIHLTAQGPKIELRIDGQLTSTFDTSTHRQAAKLVAPGHLVLQGHGAKHTPSFRNIRIRSLEVTP